MPFLPHNDRLKYRPRLTADVVTGKVDVRRAATHLSSEVFEVLLQAEDTTETELEETNADA